jgi:hypothetical protein
MDILDMKRLRIADSWGAKELAGSITAAAAISPWSDEPGRAGSGTASESREEAWDWVASLSSRMESPSPPGSHFRLFIGLIRGTTPLSTDRVVGDGRRRTTLVGGPYKTQYVY